MPRNGCSAGLVSASARSTRRGRTLVPGTQPPLFRRRDSPRSPTSPTRSPFSPATNRPPSPRTTSRSRTAWRCGRSRAARGSRVRNSARSTAPVCACSWRLAIRSRTLHSPSRTFRRVVRWRSVRLGLGSEEGGRAVQEALGDSDVDQRIRSAAASTARASRDRGAFFRYLDRGRTHRAAGDHHARLRARGVSAAGSRLPCPMPTSTRSSTVSSSVGC